MEEYNKPDQKKNNKKQFPSIEVGNDVLIYVNIKRVFQIDLNTHTASKTLKCLNMTERDSQIGVCLQ